MRAKLQKVFLSALLCLMSSSVWALDQVDGVYQIGSAEDLREFAEIVAGGNNTANAVLTANIMCCRPANDWCGQGALCRNIRR